MNLLVIAVSLRKTVLYVSDTTDWPIHGRLVYKVYNGNTVLLHNVVNGVIMSRPHYLYILYERHLLVNCRTVFMK